MATSEIDKRIGLNVRMRRNAAGMSQETLANGLEVTFQQLQKYEKGANRIASGTLAKIAYLLGVPIQQLFEGVALSGAAAPARGQASAPPVLVAAPAGSDLPSRFFGVGTSSRELAEAFLAIRDAPDRQLVIKIASRMSRIPARSPR